MLTLLTFSRLIAKVLRRGICWPYNVRTSRISIWMPGFTNFTLLRDFLVNCHPHLTNLSAEGVVRDDENKRTLISRNTVMFKRMHRACILWYGIEYRFSFIISHINFSLSNKDFSKMCQNVIDVLFRCTFSSHESLYLLNALYGIFLAWKIQIYRLVQLFKKSCSNFDLLLMTFIMLHDLAKLYLKPLISWSGEPSEKKSHKDVYVDIVHWHLPVD